MDKASWRASLVASRTALPQATRDEEARLLAEHLGTTGWTGTVCAYLPLSTEPGDERMLEALRANGTRVLLPIVDGPVLDWAPYDGTVRRGRLGVQEPTAPPLGPVALAQASAVLLPALAVDERGVRLGKGGGYYDRTLPQARCPLVAVVRDDEVVARLPDEHHDVRVTHVLTPRAGLRPVNAHTGTDQTATRQTGTEPTEETGTERLVTE